MLLTAGQCAVQQGSAPLSYIGRVGEQVKLAIYEGSSLVVFISEFELELWWGKTSSKAFRVNNLHHDILIGYNKAEEKQHWFIRDKEVCKNFYVRARGIARTTVEKSQREIISEQRSFLSSVAVETSSRSNTDSIKAPLRDQISAWLSIFARHVGDGLPNEDIIVLLYRQLNAIYEEYQDDMNIIGEKVASESHFNATFNAVSNELKIRLCSGKLRRK